MTYRKSLLRQAILPLGILLSGLVAVVVSADSSIHYESAPPSRDGIGKVYMGREISQVMGHFGARWLERPSRLREELPGRVIDAMVLEPDSVVADIGAGTGYFAFRISPRVPQGQVLAVDVQPEMLSIMRDRIVVDGIDNVTPVLGEIDDPNLPPKGVDAVLMVDAYHEFSHPWEMMQGIVQGLRRGGRVYLVEYRGEDPTVPIKPLHKMTEAQAKLEMAAAGLVWEETLDVLPRQHLMVFRKP